MAEWGSLSGLDTYLALRAFVDELARCGLRHACTSPGSRSTPLLLSLARDPRIAASSHIDERCAAFFAVGHAKASGRPVALTCTSGTAAANFMPAVMEAHEARVPLLVLSADRPPELRSNGAGQTIDQIKLYGAAAKWFSEIDDHPATAGRIRWMRQLACRAFWTALEGRPGVVHLNFSFREPLVPERPLPDGEPGGGGRAGGRPWLARPRSVTDASPGVVNELDRLLAGADRPAIIAGRQERDAGLGPALADFAERSGIPLLADPLSSARRGATAVAHYDALLRRSDWARRHAPDLVLRFGDLPTSKPLRTWLHELPDTPQVVFDPEAAWQDPAGVASIAVTADPRRTLHALQVPSPTRFGDWRTAWTAADRRAAGAIAEVLPSSGLSEPRLAAELGSWLPPDATLVVAASMPIRDVETFFPARRHDVPRVLANRGANGIDGTVSTAFGIASATAGPVVLLIGDVAFAHDVGGLLAARRLGLALTVVLVNNDGGGIFNFLPVAREGEAFDRHVTTSHGLDFAHAAALYGCDHQRVSAPEQLRRAVSEGLTASRTKVIEVATDRAANVDLHRRVWEAVGKTQE